MHLSRACLGTWKKVDLAELSAREACCTFWAKTCVLHSCNTAGDAAGTEWAAAAAPLQIGETFEYGQIYLSTAYRLPPSGYMNTEGPSGPSRQR
jgi:hypothetical protein